MASKFGLNKYLALKVGAFLDVYEAIVWEHLGVSMHVCKNVCVYMCVCVCLEICHMPCLCVLVCSFMPVCVYT